MNAPAPMAGYWEDSKGNFVPEANVKTLINCVTKPSDESSHLPKHCTMK